MTVLRFVPEKVLKYLLAIIAVLVSLNLLFQFSTYYLGHGHVFGLVNLFSLDREANIPTWYSSSTLLLSALLLAIIATHLRGAKEKWWKHWAALGVIFLLLSVDEGASIHELSIEPVRSVLGVGGVFHWAWVVPGMAAVLVIGLAYLNFLIALPRTTRRLFVAAAVTFLSGALLLEMLGAGWFVEHGRRNMGYAAFWTAEEALEMIGVAVFIYALLVHIGTNLGTIGLGIGRRSATVEVDSTTMV